LNVSKDYEEKRRRYLFVPGELIEIAWR